MRRLKGYGKLVAWQTGVGYLLLWAVTVWALNEGAAVFGKSGVCFPDEAKVLFYWVCERTSPLSILASVVNFALTATVWAPVYLAAATVQPDALVVAVPILMLHLVGLPLGILALIRMMATALDLRRRIGAGRARPPAAPAALAETAAAEAASTAVAAVAPSSPVQRMAPPRPARRIRARSEFGLRGHARG